MLKFKNTTCGGYITRVEHSYKFLYANLNKLNVVYTLCCMDVSYTGKTYKWKIKHKCAKMLFNRANKTSVYFEQMVFLKKMSKNKIRVFLQTNKNFYDMVTILKKIRALNVFTLRGIKISNMCVYKKRGKISTYKKC